MLWVQISLRRCALDTTLCDKVYLWLAAGQWFSPVTPVSCTNKTDRHNIAEILLKVLLNTLTPNVYAMIAVGSGQIIYIYFHIDCCNVIYCNTNLGYKL
jgi:hypothetical protein